MDVNVVNGARVTEVYLRLSEGDRNWLFQKGARDVHLPEGPLQRLRQGLLEDKPVRIVVTP